MIQLKPDTLIGNCVGYSVVAGVGVGLAVQQVFTAVQTVLPADLAPLGSAMVAFLQTFGASVFVFVGNTILVEELKQARIPGVDVLKVVSTGVTTFMNSVPPSSQLALRQAYAGALRDVFVMGAVTAGLAFIASFGLGLNKSKRVTSQKPQSHERDASDAEMVLSADKL